MKEWIQAHTKAIVAGVSAAITVYLASLPDGVSTDEWMAVVAALLVPFGVTWASPANKPQAKD